MGLIPGQGTKILNASCHSEIFFLIKKKKQPTNKLKEKEIRFVVTEVGEWEEGELDEGSQKTQTTSYKTNKY